MLPNSDLLWAMGLRLMEITGNTEHVSRSVPQLPPVASSSQPPGNPPSDPSPNPVTDPKLVFFQQLYFKVKCYEEATNKYRQRCRINPDELGVVSEDRQKT